VLLDAYTVDVRFRAPLLVPSEVVFAAADGGFAVRSRAGTPHVVGVLS
jgi:hypothetical protein